MLLAFFPLFFFFWSKPTNLLFGTVPIWTAIWFHVFYFILLFNRISWRFFLFPISQRDRGTSSNSILEAVTQLWNCRAGLVRKGTLAILRPHENSSSSGVRWMLCVDRTRGSILLTLHSFYTRVLLPFTV